MHHHHMVTGHHPMDSHNNEEEEGVEPQCNANPEASAAAARSGFSIINTEYTDGFDDMSMSEVMWAMAQTTDQSNYYYVAPHSFADHENGAYQGTFFNNDLFVVMLLKPVFL